MTETELERMVVRIVGDQSHLEETLLQDAKTTVESFESIMDKGIREIQESIKELESAGKDVLPGIGDQIAKIGTELQTVGKSLSLYVTTPITALGGLAIAQFSDAEKTALRLDAAIEANGHSVEELKGQYQNFANTMQDLTTAEDDAVLGLLQTAESMGVSGEAAMRAAKNALALAAAKGIGATSAIRMTTALEQGNTHMLQRQIPALRGVKDEAERAAIAQEALAKMFGVAKAEAESLAGQSERLSIRFNNLMEDGGAILAEFITPAIVKTQEFIAWLQALSPEAKRATVYILALVASLGPLILGIGTLIIWIGMLTTALTTLGITSTAAAASLAIAYWPVVAAIAAVVGVVGGLAWAFSSATEEANRLNEAMKEGENIARKEAQAALPKDTGPITKQAVLEFAQIEEFGKLGNNPELIGEMGDWSETHKFNEKLKEQIDTFGMSHRAAEIYRLQIHGASEAELAHAKALDAKLTAMEDAHKEQQKTLQTTMRQKEQMEALGRSLTQQYATPAEKAAEKQDELRKALDAGVITNETYARGLEAIAKDLDKVAQEHVATLRVNGMDSVLAGSAEAQQRIEEFAQTSSGVDLSNIKGADAPGMLKRETNIMASLEHRWKDTEKNKTEELTLARLDMLIEIGRKQLEKESGIDLVAANLED